MYSIRIWDLPTRVFHWALVACVLGLIITGNVGGNAMQWHFRFGYAVLTLLLFRLAWGLLGGHWSRWSQLPLGPRAVLAYFQGKSTPDQLAGHNPLGSWSVLAFLLVLALQVSTGLISDDEIANMGPLAVLAPSHWVSWASSWHKNWGKLALILLVLTHVLALAWYRWKKNQKLVSAMVHGDKSLPEVVVPSTDTGKTRGLALVVFVLAALAVFALISLGQ
jgi:cytochrome b